jgi:hypothetical protein
LRPSSAARARLARRVVQIGIRPGSGWLRSRARRSLARWPSPSSAARIQSCCRT